jgi:WD40 repeat protein
MTVLAIAALVTGIFAVGQRNDARDNANLAQVEADRANQEADRANQEANRANLLADQEAAARAEADDNAAQARTNAEEATRNAALAKARELAASAIGVLDIDPELSMLLALAAVEEAPGAGDFIEGTIALRRAARRHLLVDRFRVADGEFTDAALSSDGTRLVVSSVLERGASMFDTATGEVIWTYQDTSTNDGFTQVGLSPDGSLIALSVEDGSIASDLPGVEVDESGADSFPARIVVLDAIDGSLQTTISLEECWLPLILGPAFSPDGSLFQVTTGAAGCPGEPADTWVALYDTGTWEEATRIDHGAFEGVSFSDDMTAFLVIGEEMPTQLRSWPDMEILQEFPPAHGAALSPDGTIAALSFTKRSSDTSDVRVRIYDTASGALLDVLTGPESFHTAGPFFSGDGSLLYLGTRSGSYVWDVASGDLLHALGTDYSAGATASHDGAQLASAQTDGEVLLWDLRGGSAGTPLELESAAAVWLNPDSVRAGATTALEVFAWDPAVDDLALYLTAVEPISGAVLHELRVFQSAQLSDGRFVVVPRGFGTDGNDYLGPLSVWNPEAGATTVLNDCVVEAQLVFEDLPALCTDGSPFFGYSLAVSPDGSEFVAESYAPAGDAVQFRFWDTGTLEVGRTITSAVPATGLPGLDGVMTSDFMLYRGMVLDPSTGDLVTTLVDGNALRGKALSHDGSELFLATWDGIALRFNTTTWNSEVWSVNDGENRGLALSPDGTRLAAAGSDAFVRIWSTTDLALLDLIPARMASDAVWIDDKTIAIALADGARWVVESLDIRDVIIEARTRLTRGFTADECAIYRIDPCPDLETIRSG